MADNNSVFGNDRHIVLSGGIDAESMGKIILGIKLIEEDDDKQEMQVKDFKRKPIHLYISTHGGSVYAALSLIDVMDSCRTPIYTYGYGNIMSAGNYIFLAGDRRFCGKYATFMMHETAASINDYSSILTKKTEELDRLNLILDDIVASRTKVGEKLLKKWKAEREVYIDANEALKLGFVHQIL